MIELRCCKDRAVGVFGLARSGIASCHALEAGGARILAWDESAASRARAGAAGIELADLSEIDFCELDALVLSPGVPLTHPEPHWTVRRAREAGVEIIGDTELFVRELAARGSPARLAAITGTNGKSTTTALLAHVLKSAGIDTRIGGNIGTAVLDLDMPADGGVFVLEFSSYQLDLTPSLKPDVAILLNLTPDHLDRHGDFAGYARAKARIFANQTRDDVAVIGIDDRACRDIAADVAGGPVRLVRLSAENTVKDGVFVDDGVIFEADGGAVDAGTDIGAAISLRGVHNWQNAGAAFAAARALGLERAAIASGLNSFPGLAHRMQPIARRGPVVFVNDSKATNADAAARALACFERIYWIAGGRQKEGGIDSLNSFFPKIVKAYLIGEAADAFAGVLSGGVAVSKAGVVETAVAEAAADAGRDGAEGTVVLFSPACASFDQYSDFEARGEAFAAAVAGVEGIEMFRRSGP